MRLFVAVDLPEHVKTLLHDLREDDLPGVRWTKPNTWHVTLHFIGERDDDAAIQAALAAVEANGFRMSLRGVGTFPKKGKPRVLWAGIQAPDELQFLHQAVGDALKTTGYQPETRPYHPHLTLARFKQKAPNRHAMQAYLERHADFETESFPVTDFTLYQSQLQPAGSVYTVRQRLALH